jgi:hypothetical protein
VPVVVPKADVYTDAKLDAPSVTLATFKFPARATGNRRLLIIEGDRFENQLQVERT